MFGTMKYLNVLRVQTKVEVIGLDRIKHGEPAYPVGGYNPSEHPLDNAAKGNPCKHGLLKAITVGDLPSSEKMCRANLCFVRLVHY